MREINLDNEGLGVQQAIRRLSRTGVPEKLEVPAAEVNPEGIIYYGCSTCRDLTHEEAVARYGSLVSKTYGRKDSTKILNWLKSPGSIYDT